MINLRRAIVLSSLGLLMPKQRSSARGQDSATAVPDMKALLENERVRVQFHDVKVGEKMLLHTHPAAHVANVFSPDKARFALADGSVKAAERKSAACPTGAPSPTGREHGNRVDT